MTTCLHCGRRPAVTLGSCAECIKPSPDAPSIGDHERIKRNAKVQRERARERRRKVAVVAAALTALPADHEQRLVVDWATGRVAGAVVYHRTESANAVEDAHREACRAAGVWTPAIGRAS